jgi:hypothetical protein
VTDPIFFIRRLKKTIIPFWAYAFVLDIGTAANKAKEGNIFAALCLVLKYSLINLAALIGDRYILNMK